MRFYQAHQLPVERAKLFLVVETSIDYQGIRNASANFIIAIGGGRHKDRAGGG